MTSLLPSSQLLLVTGASGFLGTTVVQAARAAGWRVRAAIRTRPILCEADEKVRVDVTEDDVNGRLCRGVYAVVHCAGLAHRFAGGDDADFFRVNRDGAARVVASAASAGAKHCVLASSIAVYGSSRTARTEDATCHPETSYGASKLAGEEAAILEARKTGMQLTILRFATLYGPGDPGNVGRLLRLLRRRWFVPPRAGRNCKTLVYVEDAAHAIVVALGRTGSAIATYNVTAAPVPMNQFLTVAYAAVGRRPPRVSVPVSPLLAAAKVAARVAGPASAAADVSAMLTKWGAEEVVDGSRFARETGFVARMPLATGLRHTAATMWSPTSFP